MLSNIVIDKLKKNIYDKTAVIGIFGLGYVGLPLALTFAEAGFQVLGFDIDHEKIKSIEKGESYFRHIESERIAKVTDSGKLDSTTDFSRAAEVDAIILCVPTPLNRYREPDLTYVINTIDSIVPFLRAGQIVSLESTTYPGTTHEEIKPRIEQRGFMVGVDIFLVYSPEREDPGNKNFSTSKIPKVVGGVTENCLELGTALYASIVERVVPVSTTGAAELTKLLENIYRAVNIGLVNEMKIIADRMGIDIWEVIDAAASKPFGFTPFYPGPGLGGHCIPIDPFYLTWKAREYELNTRFIELAGEINTAMPEWVIQKVVEGLNEHCKPVKGSKVIVLGLAYKKNVDDIRESPSVRLLELLRNRGADYAYIDDYFPHFPKMREHSFDMSSETFSADVLRKADCVIIATDHDYFDYDMIVKESKLVVDTRGRLRSTYDNVIRC